MNMSDILPYYEIHGEGGPLILFVHGFLSSRAQWAPNLAAFTRRYRPVVVELLGHGRSPSPADPAAYSPSAYVEYFERIRRSASAKRWYVVGASLGAALTLRYSLDYPERVTAQVFTNSNSALAPPGWEETVRPFLEQQASEFESDGRAALKRHPLNPMRASHLPPQVKAAFRKDLALHNPRGIAMTGLYTILQSPVYERVEENIVPTLMVVGERDIRFDESRRFAEKSFPHLTVLATNAGHAVNLGAIAEFNEAVLSFFARHLRGIDVDGVDAAREA
jgi:pimeloyl-ACP methyl ester carboxylesterase